MLSKCATVNAGPQLLLLMWELKLDARKFPLHAGHCLDLGTDWEGSCECAEVLEDGGGREERDDVGGAAAAAAARVRGIGIPTSTPASQMPSPPTTGNSYHNLSFEGRCTNEVLYGVPQGGSLLSCAVEPDKRLLLNASQNWSTRTDHLVCWFPATHTWSASKAIDKITPDETRPDQIPDTQDQNTRVHTQTTTNAATTIRSSRSTHKTLPLEPLERR